jgi:DtxR family Mn-dependent transcriptional regulator
MDTTRTQAEQDYLKAIFDLSEGGGHVTTSRLARHLGLSPASVTGMLQRLASDTPPLVTYRKHHGAALSPEGETEALRVVRHHRLIESFLHRTLGLGWDAVHAEAHRLEHAISPAVEDLLSASLGEPTRDPHGDPIPDRDLHLPVSTDTPLSQLMPGETAIIRRIGDSDPAFLRHVAALGLLPGVSLHVVDASAFDHVLRVRVSGQVDPLVVGLAISDRLLVEAEA